MVPTVEHRQRLELTLDLFRGCGHHCAGCMIDKSLGGEISDLPDLLALVREMTAVGYVAFDLALGPTDYMSATNTQEVMTNLTFREMVKLFGQVTFNAAFLDTNLEHYDDMCQDIDYAIACKPVRFLIPAVPSHFKNEKFGKMIRDKLKYVQEALFLAHLDEAGFVINCTQETVDDRFEEYLRNGFAMEFLVDKDDILNIPYGRAPNKDLMVAQNVRRVSHRISSFYAGLDGDDERSRNPDLHYDTGTMLNLLYTGGKLYWVPFLKDECPFLDDDFEVKRPWSMANLLETRERSRDASLEYLKDTPCLQCPQLGSCADKGITSIMQKLSIHDCLVGL